MMTLGQAVRMRLDVYGRFTLIVEREQVSGDTHLNEGASDYRWRVFQVGFDGKRGVRDDIVIPDSVTEEQVPQYVDDLLHEYAHPGARVVRIDVKR